MFPTIVDFIVSNAAFFASVLALIISLRANSAVREGNWLAKRAKEEVDRIRRYELRASLLNEIDLQHTRAATVMMLTARKMMLFNQNPQLHEVDSSEFSRLKNNLEVTQKMQATYDERRQTAEVIREGSDMARTLELLANERRLTIHLEKEILHEEQGLLDLSERVRAAKAALYLPKEGP